jgi:hypothetical protein
VPQLPLENRERDSFAGELDGVGMPQLVRRKASPDTRFGGEATELGAYGGTGPRSDATGGTVDHAEQRSDG